MSIEFHFNFNAEKCYNLWDTSKGFGYYMGEVDNQVFIWNLHDCKMYSFEKLGSKQRELTDRDSSAAREVAEFNISEFFCERFGSQWGAEITEYVEAVWQDVHEFLEEKAVKGGE